MDRDNQDPGSSSEGRQRSSEPNEKGTSPDRRRRDESVARGELLKQALRQIIGWPNYYIPFHIVLVDVQYCRHCLPTCVSGQENYV